MMLHRPVQEDGESAGEFESPCASAEKFARGRSPLEDVARPEVISPTPDARLALARTPTQQSRRISI